MTRLLIPAVGNKAKRFAKFFLIGGSIALLALSKFNGSVSIELQEIE